MEHKHPPSPPSSSISGFQTSGDNYNYQCVFLLLVASFAGPRSVLVVVVVAAETERGGGRTAQ